MVVHDLMKWDLWTHNECILYSVWHKLCKNDSELLSIGNYNSSNKIGDVNNSTHIFSRPSLPKSGTLQKQSKNMHKKTLIITYKCIVSMQHLQDRSIGHHNLQHCLQDSQVSRQTTISVWPANTYKHDIVSCYGKVLFLHALAHS
jgi:hypothetical protein